MVAISRRAAQIRDGLNISIPDASEGMISRGSLDRFVEIDRHRFGFPSQSSFRSGRGFLHDRGCHFFQFADSVCGRRMRPNPRRFDVETLGFENAT
jgi:hypothetical protein